MERKTARRYAVYLKKAQKKYHPVKINEQILQNADHFTDHGHTSFWTDNSREIAQKILEKIKTEESVNPSVWKEEGRYYKDHLFQVYPELIDLFQGELGQFLKACYSSEYKIFYGVLYKSVRTSDRAQGSQLWHSDGGPGTCINLMFCLGETTSANGAMECIPWKESYQIQTSCIDEYNMFLNTEAAKKLSRLQLREYKAELYKSKIEKKFKDKIVQPTGESGMIFPFRNNLVHKGGYPDPRHERYVMVFHIYPSVAPVNLEKYRTSSISKSDPYPKDPAFTDP